MRALSIRQPWANLIIAGQKPVENRSWLTHYRGPLLIHAALKQDISFSTSVFLRERGLTLDDVVALENAPRGGIIGMVDLVDCVYDHPSPWAIRGEYHWVLANPRRLPFHRGPGKLGLFDVQVPVTMTTASQLLNVPAQETQLSF